MIKTTYDIELNIDEEIFKFRVKEPGLKEQKELKLRGLESEDLIANLEQKAKKEGELSLKMGEISQILEVNKEILKSASLGDRVKILIENKELIKELTGLKQELANLSDDGLIAKVEESVESLLKYKSELLLSGGEVAALFSTMNLKGISHKKLWDALSEELGRAEQKK